MKKYFFDSSLIIEFTKGNPKAVEIVQKLNIPNFQFFINPVVFSEVTYILMREVKLDISLVIKAIQTFKILNIDDKTVNLAIEYISQYKLRPNDALILASCKLHNLDYLVSLDSDFQAICKAENINLINN
jgi:predicted nucleic acid-binding protein